MPYPPVPKFKQYELDFPLIATRPVPSPTEIQSVESNPVSMQDANGQKRSETLSRPKKLDLGVLRLWLEGGGRKSKSYDDGPDFDYGGKSIVKVEEGELGLNLAPGTEDEKLLTVGWQVYGLENIQSAKLELFCKGVGKPIWERHYGNGWGKQTEGIDAFQKLCKKGDLTATGELKFSEIQVDKEIKAKPEGRADGKEEVAFPKGLLTVARSPYQLRLTVSGCTAEKTPPTGDDYVYPMTAWTHFHVLVHDFKYRFGDPKWLPKTRDDLDDAYKERVLGKDDKPGLEKQLLEQLRGFVKSTEGKEAMQEDTTHLVTLPTPWNKAWPVEESEIYAKMWGLGTRIPLVASCRIRTLAGQPTEERAADVLWNARLLWDWGESDPKRLEKACKSTATLHDGSPDLGFLQGVVGEASKDLLPSGSLNCPATYGGKLGKEDQPFFLPQPEKGNGDGSLPFQVLQADKRRWAVVSRFDDKGETGVVLFPSRFAGDTYKVRTYLSGRGVDTRDAIEEGLTAVGSPGTFVVQRKIDVHHLVIGGTPGVKVDQIQEEAKTAARTQAWLHLDFVMTSYVGQAYLDFMKEVRKDLLAETAFTQTLPYHGLELKRALLFDRAPDSGLVEAASHGDLADAVEQAFRRGALRIVENDLKFAEERLGLSDAVVGAKGSTGCLFDIGDTFGPDAKRVAYALSDPGQPAFEAGEKVTSGTNGKQKALTFASTFKSCWDVVFLPEKVDKETKTITVRFPGNKSVALAFKKGPFVASELTTKMKTDLQKAFDEAVAAFNDGEQLDITVAAYQKDSTSNVRRREAVSEYLGTLASTRLVHRKKVFEALKNRGNETSQSDLLTSMTPAAHAEKINGFVAGEIVSAIAYTYARTKKLAEGTVLVHTSRNSTISDSTVPGSGTDATPVPVVKDFDYGNWITPSPPKEAKDALGLQKPEFAKVGLVRLVTPDSRADTYYFKDQGKVPKKAWAVLLHELGHSLWLEHVTASRPGQPAASSPKPHQHVRGGVCIMSYDRDTNLLCGLCMLRLRGWRWGDLADKPSYPKLELQFRVGEIDSIFPDPVGSLEGRQQRLQALGLFNRPLRHATEEFEPFRKEFWECWDYSWKLAKYLFPGVETNPRLLNEALRTFVVEDGKLPDPGEQARFRVAGHYSPFYANMDVAMRYGDADKKDSRENAFKMLAIRGNVEAYFQGGNPGMGAYPVQVLVTDEKGNAMPFCDVWIHLAKPDAPTAWDKDFAGKKVLDCTSFVKGTGPCPLAGTEPLQFIESWFKTNIDGFEPKPETDPQLGNVHAKMGGKRRMHGDELDLATPLDGMRNVFSVDPLSGDTTVNRAVAGGGGIVKGAIQLKTDHLGVARFLFTPSTVGGDRYKLRATARHPDNKLEVGSAETGTFVVWKTQRVAAYYQVPNYTDESQLPATLLPWKQRGSYSDNEAFYRPLVPIDLRRSVGDEMARAYCEVLFEEDALVPKPLDADFFRRFDAWVAKLGPIYNTEEYQSYHGAKLMRVLLTHAGGKTKTWTGRVPVKVRTGQVGVWMLPMDGKFRVNDLLAHADPATDPAATKAKLVPVAKDSFVFNLDQDHAPSLSIFTSGVGVGYRRDKPLPVEVDPVASEFDYATGDLAVTFKTDPVAGPPAWVTPGEAWGEILSVSGATAANTDGGRLHATVRASKLKGTWNVYFYKSAAKQAADFVAKAKRNRAGTKSVARAVGTSGLSIHFKMGKSLVDGQTNVVNLGFPVIHAAYVAEEVVDVANAFEHSTRGPWLLSYRTAAEYNRARNPRFPAAELPEGSDLTPWENVAGEKAAYSWAETIFMRALGAALRDQGFGYYPGLFYIQANYFNPIQGAGLGGKGVGNMALIFNQGLTHEPKLHYLTLHETGHCHYGVHCPNEPGHQADFHAQSEAEFKFWCIMGQPNDLDKAPPRPVESEELKGEALAGQQKDWDTVYENPSKSYRTFCPRCNAGLRGIWVLQPPLFNKKNRFLGNAALHRNPSTGTPTGGLALPESTPDPHLIRATEEQERPLLDLASLFDESDEDVIVPEFEMIPQEKSNWCWAAASQMMRRFYGQETITQAALASAALFDDGTDCSLDKNDGRCNVEHALALTGLEHDSSGEGTPLTFEQIKGEIDDGHPFVVARARHYLVCYGYNETDTEQTLLLFDPLPVKGGMKTRLKYEEYKSHIATQVQVTGGGVGKGANYYNFRKKT